MHAWPAGAAAFQCQHAGLNDRSEPWTCAVCVAVVDDMRAGWRVGAEPALREQLHLAHAGGHVDRDVRPREVAGPRMRARPDRGPEGRAKRNVEF